MIVAARRPLAMALLLAAVQAVLLARTAWDKSDTIDEPVYLRAGVGQWLNRHYRWNYGSPALPKWGFALAIRLADPPLFEALASRPSPAGLYTATGERLRRDLFAARSATILVTVGAGLLLWSAARRLGGDSSSREPAALVAHALWCFSPSLLATGSLATLDAWAASLAAAAVWAGVRLHECPGAGRAAVAGAALALAGACKVPTLGLAPLVAAVGAAAVVRRSRTAGRSWRAALVAPALAFAAAFVLTLWAVYGFTVGRVAIAGVLVGPLPFPLWIDGILFQIRHAATGHRGYLFGETSDRGWWWYYLAVLAFKVTVGAQGLTLLRLAAWVRRRPVRREMLTDALLLAYPVLLFVVMSLGRTQIGIQYLLPAFPCVILWIARGLPDALRAFGAWGRRAFLGALAAAALESLAVHPHHLMFYNLWAGGPAGGPRYLIHGCDIGQEQRRLAEWQAREAIPANRLYYTVYSGKPSAWGLRYRRADCDPAPGVYALQAIEVHRPKRLPRGCLDWLTVEPPDERLGHSIYVYRVDEARIARMTRKRTSDDVFWRSGRPGEIPGSLLKEAGPESEESEGSVDGSEGEP